MYDSVKKAFPGFTEVFEGNVPWMYLDIKGLVTTARGNLIDPSGFEHLPWTDHTGGSASAGQIINAWHAVKNRQDLKMYGGGSHFFAELTDLRLSRQAIDDLTLAKALEMEGHLKSRFSNWNTMPADAQLGILSVAWACGPAFNFPRFEAAIASEDWVACSTESHIEDSQNPGLRPRDATNMHLFLSAAATVNVGGDLSAVNGW